MVGELGTDEECFLTPVDPVAGVGAPNRCRGLFSRPERSNGVARSQNRFSSEGVVCPETTSW